MICPLVENFLCVWCALWFFLVSYAGLNVRSRVLPGIILAPQGVSTCIMQEDPMILKILKSAKGMPMALQFLIQTHEFGTKYYLNCL